MTNYFIAGGGGFIGGSLAKRLLHRNELVTIYDNFSSRARECLDSCFDSSSTRIVEGDIKDREALTEAMKGADVVYHFASNPDIAKAVAQPDIDFWEGTLLTNQILEAMRVNGVRKLLYASGSGVYGDAGDVETPEDYSPMRPISTYGASKLACEALICAYCHMFDFSAAAFRFANVVGDHQTHGVGYDFLRRLKKDGSALEILGNGKQSKSYIYVDDVLNAMELIEKAHLSGFSCYNVATEDAITVDEIAEIAMELLDLKDVELRYTGTDRGWKGDVPIVRINSDKIRGLGWKNQYNSREAMFRSIANMNRNGIC